MKTRMDDICMFCDDKAWPLSSSKIGNKMICHRCLLRLMTLMEYHAIR